jgi:uncharacterized membrane protein YfcA
MAHIDIRHIPFVFCILPFFAVGIATPATIQDWYHGRLIPGDGLSILVGLVVVSAWEWAILFSIKSKKRRGQTRLLGRELASWYWAPPITFIVGIVSGLVFIS